MATAEKQHPGWVTVVVQGVPDRGLAWERSRESIEASDIGTDYMLMLNPEGVNPRQHFLNVMQRLADAPTEWVLRLEDDAIVNRHIVHNLRTWPALTAPDFGCGWGFFNGHQQGPWKGPELHGSLATLFRRAHLPAVMAGCKKWFAAHKGRLSQDLAMSRTVWDLGKRLYLHQPPLVEHPIDTPSTLGHLHNRAAHTTRGRFQLEWKRELI